MRRLRVPDGHVPLVPLAPGIVFLDVETSGLGPGSYPVEVGLCGDGLDPVSWLVRPDPAWVGWSPEAERIHGIRRGDLADGLDAPASAARLDAALRGRLAVSDAPDHDAAWLDALHRAGGAPRRYRVVGFVEAVLAAPDPSGAARDLDRACAACAGPYPRTHRAGEDALCLAAAWRAAVDPVFLLRATAMARGDARR